MNTKNSQNVRRESAAQVYHGYFATDTRHDRGPCDDRRYRPRYDLADTQRPGETFYVNTYQLGIWQECILREKSPYQPEWSATQAEASDREIWRNARIALHTLNAANAEGQSIPRGLREGFRFAIFDAANMLARHDQIKLAQRITREGESFRIVLDTPQQVELARSYHNVATQKAQVAISNWWRQVKNEPWLAGATLLANAAGKVARYAAGEAQQLATSYQSWRSSQVAEQAAPVAEPRIAELAPLRRPAQAVAVAKAPALARKPAGPAQPPVQAAVIVAPTPAPAAPATAPEPSTNSICLANKPCTWNERNEALRVAKEEHRQAFASINQTTDSFRERYRLRREANREYRRKAKQIYANFRAHVRIVRAERKQARQGTLEIAKK